LKLLPIELPPRFNVLGLRPSNCWQPSEKQLLVVTLEQALRSKAPAINTTLKRFDFIFQFPLAAIEATQDLTSSSYVAKPPEI
jgi:hypothetical protein